MAHTDASLWSRVVPLLTLLLAVLGLSPGAPTCGPVPVDCPTGSPCADPTRDDDGDGWPASNDCDDSDPDVHPGAPERCGDGVDEDCDGVRDEECACAEPWCDEAFVELTDGCAGQSLTWPLGDESALHLYSVYSGTGSPQSIYLELGCTRRPVVLVLSAYDPIDWVILPAPGAVIERVIVACSYGPQTVLGVPEGLVEEWCEGGRVRYDWSPGCDGTPQRPAEIEPYEAYTGARLASFSGCYQGEWFTLAHACREACDADAACAGRTCGVGECGMSCGVCAPKLTCAPGGQCVRDVDCVDADGDGFGAGAHCRGADCDDGDPDVNPWARERLCDGVDNDCDPATADAPDADGDGFDVCSPDDVVDPDGRTPDCRDDTAAAAPGRTEIYCDGLDNDCDPATGDGLDADGDTFDNCGMTDAANPDCLPVDCDDGDGWVFPGAPELPGDGLDTDCDGADLVPSNSTGVFVAPSGHDGAPGTMEAPKQTIRSAISLANGHGKVVFVAAGEYEERIGAVVSLYGGYESSGWTRDIETRATVLRAPGERFAVHADFQPRSFPGGAQPAPGAGAIQGFTLVGRGAGDDSYAIISDPHTSVGLRLLLADNAIDGGGGDKSVGVHVESHVVRFVRNRISGGTGAGNSIGVEFRSFYSDVTSAEFVGNEIDGGGAPDSRGIYVQPGHHAALSAHGNSIGGGDGQTSRGFVLHGTTLRAWNNVLSGGSGNFASTALEADAESRLLLAHNVVDGGAGRGDSTAVGSCGVADFVNNILLGGSGLRPQVVRDCFSLRLVHNVLWAPAGALHGELTAIEDVEACSWAGCREATGNRSVDPRFADATARDYHLAPGSPCVDAGVDPGPFGLTVATDVDGDPRPAGAGWDIGLDELVSP